MIIITINKIIIEVKIIKEVIVINEVVKKILLNKNWNKKWNKKILNSIHQIISKINMITIIYWINKLKISKMNYQFLMSTKNL